VLKAAVASPPRGLSFHVEAPTDYSLTEDFNVPVVNPVTEEEVYVGKALIWSSSEEYHFFK